MTRGKTILAFLIITVSVISIAGCNNHKLIRDVRSLSDGMWILVGELEQGEFDREINGYFPIFNREGEIHKQIQKDTSEKGYPQDHIYFVEAEMVDVKGVPLIRFIFVAPKKCTNPGDIFKIYLDNTVTSSQIRFGTERKNYLDYLIYQGRYSSRDFIDPSKPHIYKLALEVPGRPRFVREFHIEADTDADINIQTELFQEKHEKGSVVEIEDGSFINLGKSVNARDINTINSNEYIPLIDANYAEKMISRLDELMGTSTFPANGFVFLWANPEGDADNPPFIDFTFIGPHGGVKMGDVVEVHLDGDDVTREFKLYKFPYRNNTLDLCCGTCNTLEYLNPSEEHTCEIFLKMYDGVTYKRTIKFRVEKKDLVRIDFEGFPVSDDPRKRDKIVVRVMVLQSGRYTYCDFTGKYGFPKMDEELKSRILNTDNWTLEYEDDSQVPKIIEVTGDPMMLTLKLDSYLEWQSKTLFLKFSPMEGLWSEPCKFKF